MESLSTYARQFLDKMQKPEVDHIDGLSPAIAIEQRSAGGNPRSIVATTTEIYDYLRLLFAHIGKAHCPKCGKPVKGQSTGQICDHIKTLEKNRKMILLAPYVRGQKGEHRDIIDKLRVDGFVRTRIDGELVLLDEKISLDKNIKHTIEAVVDRLVTGTIDNSRLTDSVERCLQCGEGLMTVLLENPNTNTGWQEELISEHLACTTCNISVGELQPRNFSFNSPYGACKRCHGFGAMSVADESKIIDPRKSIGSGAVPLFKMGPRRLIIYNNHLLRCVAEHYGFDLKTPYKDLPGKIQKILLHGSEEEKINFSFRWRRKKVQSSKPFEGIIPLLNRRFQETESVLVRDIDLQTSTDYRLLWNLFRDRRPNTYAEILTLDGNLPAQ